MNMQYFRDPGNYGELAMITLPLPVKARFVILGIVSFDKNPCLKFELMGCEDEPEENRHLGKIRFLDFVSFLLFRKIANTFIYYTKLWDVYLNILLTAEPTRFYLSWNITTGPFSGGLGHHLLKKISKTIHYEFKKKVNQI